jgi:hypothetical protein
MCSSWFYDIVGSIPVRVNTKTIKLAFYATHIERSLVVPSYNTHSGCTCDLKMVWVFQAILQLYFSVINFKMGWETFPLDLPLVYPIWEQHIYHTCELVFRWASFFPLNPVYRVCPVHIMQGGFILSTLPSPFLIHDLSPGL